MSGAPQQQAVDPYSFVSSAGKYKNQSNDELTQEQIDRINAQIEALNAIGSATNDEGFHQQLYGRYLDLIGGMYPGRPESIQEAAALSESTDPAIASRGSDVLTGLTGAPESGGLTKENLLNQYLQKQFEDQFAVEGESPTMAAENLRLREIASQNPNLVKQYLSNSTDPTFGENVADWFSSWKGGEQNTLDALRNRRRLNKSGYTGGYLD